MTDPKTVAEAFYYLKDLEKTFLIDLSSHFINLSESDETFLSIRNSYAENFITQAQSHLIRLELGELQLDKFKEIIDQIRNSVFYNFNNEIHRSFPNAKTARDHGKEGGTEPSEAKADSKVVVAIETEIPGFRPIKKEKKTSTGKKGAPTAPAPEGSSAWAKYLETKINTLLKQLVNPDISNNEAKDIRAKIKLLEKVSDTPFNTNSSENDQLFIKLFLESGIDMDTLNTLFADLADFIKSFNNTNKTDSANQNTNTPENNSINTKLQKSKDNYLKAAQIKLTKYNLSTLEKTVLEELLKFLQDLDFTFFDDPTTLAIMVESMERNELTQAFENLFIPPTSAEELKTALSNTSTNSAQLPDYLTKPMDLNLEFLDSISQENKYIKLIEEKIQKEENPLFYKELLEIISPLDDEILNDLDTLNAMLLSLGKDYLIPLLHELNTENLPTGVDALNFLSWSF